MNNRKLKTKVLMHHYKLKISYKGTDYFGWQMQPEVEKPTVQGTIYKVVQKISRYQQCRVVGASRTDAGVHAQGQVVKVSIPSFLEPSKLLQGMNSMLPIDIRVLECDASTDEFNPINDSKLKKYRYYFSNNEIENSFLNETVNNIFGELDINAMREGAKLFVGEHDFFNFARRDGNAATTVRTIESFELHEDVYSSLNGPIYYFEIVGNGFLKQMVRYMASALFAVGHNKINPSLIKDYLLEHKDDKLCPKSKGLGLHLMSVVY
ncbi:MAG: tRNA pseudouridine(38-40) synthase TruA [Bacteriovoracaceae bacterium]|nr:tRNA pseudouridine(38-40) synthase TruA [Bacteriovoracaceae bacterium]